MTSRRQRIRPDENGPPKKERTRSRLKSDTGWGEPEWARNHSTIIDEWSNSQRLNTLFGHAPSSLWLRSSLAVKNEVKLFIIIHCLDCHIQLYNPPTLRTSTFFFSTFSTFSSKSIHHSLTKALTKAAINRYLQYYCNTARLDFTNIHRVNQREVLNRIEIVHRCGRNSRKRRSLQHFSRDVFATKTSQGTQISIPL